MSGDEGSAVTPAAGSSARAARVGRVVGWASGPRQAANAQDLGGTGCAQRGRRQRDDGHGFAGGREELDLVAFRRVAARAVVLDDHSDVSGLEPVFGNVCRQHDALERSECHGLASGRTVTSRALCWPLRTIQIVLIQAVFPFGPFSGTRISYLRPYGDSFAGVAGWGRTCTRRSNARRFQFACEYPNLAR